MNNISSCCHDGEVLVLTAGEDLTEGLLIEQLLSPIRLATMSSALFINFCQPHRFCRNSDVVSIPICPPPRFLFLTRFVVLLWPIAYLFALIAVVLIKRRGTIGVIHARGYFAGLVSSIIKRLYRASVAPKIVFDPRSLFIQELLSSKSFRKGALAERLWRKAEQMIISSADAILCVSRGQKKYYEQNYGQGNKCHIQPCFAPMPIQLHSHPSRAKYGIDESDIVIGYYGSLNKGWNNVDVYIDICKTNPHYKFLFISQDNEVHANLFGKYENIISPSTKNLSQSEILSILALCDYGLIYMEKSLDWESRLGVKFVTYLSVGLGVIVSKYVGEAAYYCREFFEDRSIVIDSRILPRDLKRTQKSHLTDPRMSIFSPERLSDIYSKIIKDEF